MMIALYVRRLGGIRVGVNLRMVMIVALSFVNRSRPTLRVVCMICVYCFSAGLIAFCFGIIHFKCM